jgi:hypothetical protein
MNVSPIALSIILVISFLCLVKTFLFISIADDKTFLSWFRFSMNEIYKSPGKRTQKAKKDQNRFTIIIIAASIIGFIFYLILPAAF